MFTGEKAARFTGAKGGSLFVVFATENKLFIDGVGGLPITPPDVGQHRLAGTLHSIAALFFQFIA
jgi:hypothetical protein